ncbi:glycoside hydrolase family 5 protein [Exilibacterium tricleocarpae]|uniref:Glycoside hydrolase family 5 protein n=2 Tax=Exilibacterium tricleocarpae TaxID=2591008 RepID=A0A545TFT6_9GAMM|nr:glycoside hydrolase family 5 protein [Exilibacterium tricleocarpae]
MSSTAARLASRITLGWNLGNSLEAIGGETAWGNPRTTRQLIQLVKSSGFDSIRLPVSWDQYADQATAEIDRGWMNRVTEVAQWCLDSDMTVLLNIHWDGGWLEQNVYADAQELVNAKQKALWQQIATHFRDFDERLMFAGSNEPAVEDASGMGVLLSYHQTFIDAVRATGGKNAYRILVVQGPTTDIEKTHQFMRTLPEDTVADRLMVEVHFYTPYQFALMLKDEPWGNQFFYWGAGNHSQTDTAHNPTGGEEARVDQLFGLMKTRFADRGIPVVLGEYAAINRFGQLSGDNLQRHIQSRAYWHRYITQSALANGLLPYYWDNGSNDKHSSGIFDRDTNTVFDIETLNALNQGVGRQAGP